MNDASSPSKNSSITTLLPAVPKVLSLKILSNACFASSIFWQIITPLPAAKPSALTTVGKLVSFRYSTELSKLSNDLYLAVGILYLTKKSLEKVFEPSNCAACFDGPNVLIFLRRPLSRFIHVIFNFFNHTVYFTYFLNSQL